MKKLIIINLAIPGQEYIKLLDGKRLCSEGHDSLITLLESYCENQA